MTYYEILAGRLRSRVLNQLMIWHAPGTTEVHIEFPSGCELVVDERDLLSEATIDRILEETRDCNYSN